MIMSSRHDPPTLSAENVAAMLIELHHELSLVDLELSLTAIPIPARLRLNSVINELDILIQIVSDLDPDG